MLNSEVQSNFSLILSDPKFKSLLYLHRAHRFVHGEYYISVEPGDDYFLCIFRAIDRRLNVRRVEANYVEIEHSEFIHNMRYSIISRYCNRSLRIKKGKLNQVKRIVCMFYINQLYRQIENE